MFVILLIAAGMAALYLLLTASGGLDENPLMRYLCYNAIALIGFVCSYACPNARLLGGFFARLPRRRRRRKKRNDRLSGIFCTK